MRKLLLASAILTIGVAGASAADLGPRSYTKAPALAPAYDWSGFYIGGQAGAASLSPSFKDDDHFFDSQSFNPDRKYSFTGGVYGGYNWQLNSLVVGVDAQWSWYGDNSVTIFPFGTRTAADSSFFLSTKVLDAGSVKARVGLAFQDTLVYVAAGPAWANSTFTVAGGDIFNEVSETAYRSGIAVAAGAEHMFTPHLVGRGQIQYSDFGTQHLTTIDRRLSLTFGQQTSIVEATAGLAYKF
jgi:outer membrane immunogenic protein